MADIFISYSRRDKDFVRSLASSLKQHKCETWVDWQDIPPTAKFLKEIYTGIEEASIFVFVLSPDSITSEVCLKEIRHAEEYSKKIIPLLYRPVDLQRVPASVRELNWISFVENDSFDTAFQQVLFALETDLNYWHQAAQWLKRAKLWESKQHNASILLRGIELKEAESWLHEGAQKKPHPTALQQDFIAKSRRAARRRSIISIVFTVLLVGGLVGGGAWQLSHQPPDPTRVTTLDDSGSGSLRQAINTSPQGSTITFAPGLHGTILLTSGNITTAKHLTIRGPGANTLAISSGTGGYYIHLLSAAFISISGLAFKDSIIQGAFSFIFNEGTLTLTNCIISGNTTIQGSGGGIHNYLGKLILTNSIVSSNRAKNGDGGGIENTGTFIVTNSTISDNSAGLGGSQNVDGGGGISNSGTLTLTNSTISANTTSVEGGGIINLLDGVIHITNSILSDNTAEFGGGIDNSKTLIIDNSTIIHNHAEANSASNTYLNSGSGGGIYNGIAGTLTLTNSTISANTADIEGGGIDNVLNSKLSMTNTTLSGNTTRYGGAINNIGSQIDMTFCTIYGNRVKQTGVMQSSDARELSTGKPPYSHVVLRNTLIARNSTSSGPAFLGKFISEGYNLIQDSSGLIPVILSSTDMVIDPGVDVKIDDTLRDNGGQAQPHARTHALLLGSPAIDRIPLNVCLSNNILTDQRGMKRPDGQESTCDIGAYESQS